MKKIIVSIASSFALSLIVTTASAQEGAQTLNELSKIPLASIVTKRDDEPCGLNEILHGHIGCIYCRAEVGVTYANFLCTDGELTRVTTCTTGPNRCPYRPGAVCDIYAGTADFTYLGDEVCFNMGDFGDGDRYFYAECIAPNHFRGDGILRKPSDPKCRGIINDPGGDPLG